MAKFFYDMLINKGYKVGNRKGNSNFSFNLFILLFTLAYTVMTIYNIWLKSQPSSFVLSINMIAMMRLYYEKLLQRKVENDSYAERNSLVILKPCPFVNKVRDSQINWIVVTTAIFIVGFIWFHFTLDNFKKGISFNAKVLCSLTLSISPLVTFADKLCTMLEGIYGATPVFYMREVGRED